MINLGDKVKDKITGFTGIVISHSTHLNGCVRYGVQSSELNAGKPIDPEWFDSQQLALVKAGAVTTQSAPTGGPRPAPKQHPNPR